MGSEEFPASRNCARCGRSLSRYNKDDYCGPCSAAGARAGLAGDSFPGVVHADMAARLRAARLRRGMSLEILGGLSGFSASFLSMVETGKRNLERYSTICAVASALGIPPSELAAGLPASDVPERRESGLLAVAAQPAVAGRGMAGASRRYCARCGTRLASDNRETKCGPCQRVAPRYPSSPPQVPGSFWKNDRLRDSLVSERHFGKFIWSYRNHPHHGRPISQQTAGAWLGISQAQLARIENGRPIEDLGRLAEWARILHVPRDFLWFSMPDEVEMDSESGGEIRIGKRVAALRRDQRMTQEELAENAGISGETVKKIEQGTRNPSMQMLATIAQALGVPVNALLDSPESSASPNVILRMIREDERQETRAEFAEAMRRKAIELGEDITPTERSIARLEAGEIRYPHPATRRVLTALCGRSMPELGFTRPASTSAGVSDVSLNSSHELTGVTKELPEPGPDNIVLNLRFDGREVAVPVSRVLLLRAGVSAFVEAFALGQQSDMVHDIINLQTRTERLTIASPAHLQEILTHLREQWHDLVRTDNLLGPRFALAGVLSQISVVEALRSTLRDDQRIEVTRIGAMYAESAAWLYEEADNVTQARSWASQAMEWAYEGNDERMLAWAIFRRAQQAAAMPDSAQTIGLAQAARRNEEKLATPTRAAIRVQEAYGYALDGNDQAAQRLLDEAHNWEAGDTVGDAREGHGSYCTPDYIEIQRAACWLATGQPKKAISLYEDRLRALPTVYQQNRAAGLTQLAVAYVTDSQPEQAANSAYAALSVARSSGSKRIVAEIKTVGTKLTPYRSVPAVAALLDDLEAEDH